MWTSMEGGRLNGSGSSLSSSVGGFLSKTQSFSLYCSVSNHKHFLFLSNSLSNVNIIFKWVYFSVPRKKHIVKLMSCRFMNYYYLHYWTSSVTMSKHHIAPQAGIAEGSEFSLPLGLRIDTRVRHKGRRWNPDGCRQYFSVLHSGRACPLTLSCLSS